MVVGSNLWLFGGQWWCSAWSWVRISPISLLSLPYNLTTKSTGSWLIPFSDMVHLLERENICFLTYLIITLLSLCVVIFFLWHPYLKWVKTPVCHCFVGPEWPLVYICNQSIFCCTILTHAEDDIFESLLVNSGRKLICEYIVLDNG
jgi:hypothetical protein